MNFGVALALLKAGKRVAREGWNGKGMFIYLVGPGSYPPRTPAGELVATLNSATLVPYRPYIAMKTVDDDVVPWVASQTDLLESDWALAKGENIGFAEIEAAADELTVELEIEDEPDAFPILVVNLGSVFG